MLIKTPRGAFRVIQRSSVYVFFCLGAPVIDQDVPVGLDQDDVLPLLRCVSPANAGKRNAIATLRGFLS